MTTESLRSARCPPLRQVRGTKLNTIIEDSRETQYSEKADRNDIQPKTTARNPPLKLRTTGLSLSSRLNRLWSPLSAGTVSSCSDTEWQQQMQSFDDLYDATDEDSEISDDCTSFASTRPTSLVTPTTRDSLTSPISRNRYPSLTIPSSTTWPSLHGGPKSSPVPPTPPPKIPVSPAALSLLGHSVPAVHAPPSLDGSVSSDQVSGISAPATPDLQSLPDTDWNAQDVHLQTDPEDAEDVDAQNPEENSDMQSIEIAIESSEEDWQQVLGNFPRIPGQATPTSLRRTFELSREGTPSDRGLLLPEDALATLRYITLDGTPEPWSETSEGNEEMWQLQTLPERPRSAGDATPASAVSGYSFSQLSIPSPGGFFSSLGPRARHTWSIPRGNKPPSSAIAESFYNLPFSRNDGEVVEQVIECSERSIDEQLTAVYDPSGPPTAIRIPPENTSEPLLDHLESPVSAGAEGVHEIERPIVPSDHSEQDDDYEDELQKKAMASLDRTSVWLAAQASYLSALRETNPINTLENDDDGQTEAAEGDPRQASPQISRKRSVRFSETVPEAPSSRPSLLASKDSIYWRGFQFVRQQSNGHDTFVHRNIRFDAVQSIRLGLTKVHTNCLLGKYELVHPDRPAYKGPFSQAPRNSVITSVLAEKAQFSMIEKEQMVLSQLSQPMWAMDALKYLNGGSLVASPALKHLTKSNTSARTQGNGRRSVRILDLGGHASCEWAWHLAHDYPNLKVYTAFTDYQSVNHGIKGPSNHKQVSVPQLWKLPFPDNKFDVISARSLPALLKTEHPMGDDRDEYDLCLEECYRCLKPGGYLEFFVMDAEISRAGPHASAMSIEFAFNLKTKGYDPTPTKQFLGRLRKGNFIDVKRAWTFLPIGVEPLKPQIPRETPEPRVKSHIEEYEAVHGPLGSTTDIASVTGLFGGWAWEQWLLKLQIEMGREQHKLLEGVGSVFDEGRKNGAGWTCLSGWAMKPNPKRRTQRGCHMNSKG